MRSDIFRAGQRDDYVRLIHSTHQFYSILLVVEPQKSKKIRQAPSPLPALLFKILWALSRKISPREREAARGAVRNPTHMYNTYVAPLATTLKLSGYWENQPRIENRVCSVGYLPTNRPTPSAGIVVARVLFQPWAPTLPSQFLPPTRENQQQRKKTEGRGKPAPNRTAAPQKNRRKKKKKRLQ